MIINVECNGFGDGEGTHVSVFGYLMRGENDDHLPWPFTGTVIIELLNQLEDDNHHTDYFEFYLEDEASNRVVKGEESAHSLGRNCFISHSDLSYDADSYCQYLKNDCLHFRVKVDTESTTKPWLAL